MFLELADRTSSRFTSSRTASQRRAPAFAPALRTFGTHAAISALAEQPGQSGIAALKPLKYQPEVKRREPVHPLRSVIAFIVVFVGPAVAMAEVSDKAPTILQHWLIAIPIAAALLVAGTFRWWLGALLAVVPAFILLGSIDMTFDQHVGPALWHEQGWLYFASLWASDLLILGTLVFGIRRGLRRQVSRELRSG